MAWIYEYNNKKYVLEELLEENDDLYSIWSDAIVGEYNFWVKEKGYTSLYDIIVEATDEFEDYCFQKNYKIEFKEEIDIELDLNLLLKPLIK